LCKDSTNDFKFSNKFKTINQLSQYNTIFI